MCAVTRSTRARRGGRRCLCGTGGVIGVGGLFHPTTVRGCQALFGCMGTAMVGLGVLVTWRKPLRSTPGVWLDDASRVCLGTIVFCMAASLVDGGTARESVAMVAYALAVVQLVIVVLRVVHQCVCWYVDAQMARSLLPLEMVWTHIPGRDKKVTQRFLAVASEVLLELSNVAKDRDNEGRCDRIDEPSLDYLRYGIGVRGRCSPRN